MEPQGFAKVKSDEKFIKKFDELRSTLKQVKKDWVESVKIKDHWWSPKIDYTPIPDEYSYYIACFHDDIILAYYRNKLIGAIYTKGHYKDLKSVYTLMKGVDEVYLSESLITAYNRFMEVG